MAGRIVFRPEAEHRCTELPKADELTPGTVWQCNDCENQWVVVEGAQYNEPYKAWRILTEANRVGLDA